ncbi:hypothetical protein GA0111570_1168 [Raineyella antarctica]|uniref:Uncharacterized protein n=1 Tax=Raineyella antarctica TaxID=1577474 RepID=A0A1G6IER7_9ACTN|nr:hypothetical protein [Raineyella antarctica]SDC04964.1 hypothetical protein GA0111570_1168 [Raineyella antarctica]
MTTYIAPQAAPQAGSTPRGILLWLGVLLTGVPPFLGLSLALSAITAPTNDAGNQALTALWYIPAAIFPVAVLGVALMLVGLWHSPGTRRAGWLWTALVAIGLLGVVGLAFGTGMNNDQEALQGAARMALDIGTTTFGLVYVAGLVGLVVLGLRLLHPSDPALARMGILLLAVALLMSALQVVQAAVIRRSAPGAGRMPAPVVMSGVGDALLWAVLGLVVLVVLVRHLHRLQAVVAVAGGVMLIGMGTLKVLGATAWRLTGGPGATGPVTLPTGLTMGMTVSMTVALLAVATLLGAAIALMGRTRTGIAT